jgi:hypothetical protein
MTREPDDGHHRSPSGRDRDPDGPGPDREPDDRAPDDRAPDDREPDGELMIGRAHPRDDDAYDDDDDEQGLADDEMLDLDDLDDLEGPHA